MSAGKFNCSVCLTFYVHLLKTYHMDCRLLFFFTPVGLAFSFSFSPAPSGVSMILGIAEGLVTGFNSSMAFLGTSKFMLRSPQRKKMLG